MTEKRCHRCGKVIKDIMYWDNGKWQYCLDCSNSIVKENYGDLMTEYKRFTRIICVNDEYTGSLFCDDEPLKIDDVCTLLNKQDEEIAELKEAMKRMMADMMTGGKPYV